MHCKTAAESGHMQRSNACPLWANSGYSDQTITVAPERLAVCLNSTGSPFRGRGRSQRRRLDNDVASRLGVYRVSHDNITAFGDDLIGILHDLELFIAAILAQPRISGRLWPLGTQSCDARQDHPDFGKFARLCIDLD